jgi:hypothetical protein
MNPAPNSIFKFAFRGLTFARHVFPSVPSTRRHLELISNPSRSHLEFISKKHRVNPPEGFSPGPYFEKESGLRRGGSQQAGTETPFIAHPASLSQPCPKDVRRQSEPMFERFVAAV